jgi:hypothetical protein|tara:strand:+ start:2042 stop:2236 length:195 start_codon:yes stop_codon:yes gene_type:complete
MTYTSNETTIVAVGGNGRSLRIVIPLWVVQQMDLKAGEKIVWKLKPKGDEFAVILTKGGNKNDK